MIPAKEELQRFNGDKKEVACSFGVSEKTATRWLLKYGLYQKQKRLDPDEVMEIRAKFNEGESVTSLAKQFKVTFSSISRVVTQQTHRMSRDVAEIMVVYNP